MKSLENLIFDMFGKDCSQCSDEEIYHALLVYTKKALSEKGYQDGKKKIYYISAEFLIGKLLSNNLINLGIYDEVAKFLEENGKSISKIEEVEPEPSLGNGGLDDWRHASLTPSPHLDFRVKESVSIITLDFSSRYSRTTCRKKLQVHG